MPEARCCLYCGTFHRVSKDYSTLNRKQVEEKLKNLPSELDAWLSGLSQVVDKYAAGESARGVTAPKQSVELQTKAYSKLRGPKKKSEPRLRVKQTPKNKTKFNLRKTKQQAGR